MKALIITFALALTACGTDKDEEKIAVSEGGHVQDIQTADSAKCQEEDRADEELEEIFQLFLDSYAQFGKNDLPTDMLKRLTVLRRDSYENMADEDSSRNGYMKRVSCDGELSRFHIVITDPATAPEGSSLKNPLLFKETVFHEIAHIFYGHYDDNNLSKTSKAGLMAGQKDIRETTEDEHGKRIEDLFGNEKYKAHLPKKFQPNNG